MTRAEAEAQRDSLMAAYPHRTWMVSEGASGEWAVTEIGHEQSIDRNVPITAYPERGWANVAVALARHDRRRQRQIQSGEEPDPLLGGTTGGVVRGILLSLGAAFAILMAAVVFNASWLFLPAALALIVPPVVAELGYWEKRSLVVGAAVVVALCVAGALTGSPA